MTDREKLVLDAYKKTINHIDDWFEYMNESKTDRKFIHEQLDILTAKLEKIYDMKKDPVYYDDPLGISTFYKCLKHDIPYPKGAICPRCEGEK